MIISIDESQRWRARSPGENELSRLLEALFRFHPARRPASRLEVIFLAIALECPEAAIEQHLAQSCKSTTPTGDQVATCAVRGSTRLLFMPKRAPQSYSPTKPA
jgi:hypothetical protein